VEETNAAIEQTEAQANELDSIVDVFKLDSGASISAVPPRGAQRKPTLRRVGNTAVAADWNEF
jgi:methyl-accepting chemotaxis protein